MHSELAALALVRATLGMDLTCLPVPAAMQQPVTWADSCEVAHVASSHGWAFHLGALATVHFKCELNSV